MTRSAVILLCLSVDGEWKHISHIYTRKFKVPGRNSGFCQNNPGRVLAQASQQFPQEFPGTVCKIQMARTTPQGQPGTAALCWAHSTPAGLSAGERTYLHLLYWWNHCAKWLKVVKKGLLENAG